MKFKLLLLILTIVLPLSIDAQTKKGFKQLKKRKYDKAEKAFKKDINSPQYGAASAYGLAKIYSRSRKNVDQLERGFEWVAKADEAYQKLTKEQKNSYKKFRVYSKSFGNLKSSIQKKFIALIEEDASILKYDTFHIKFHPIAEKAEETAELKRKQLVSKSLQQLNSLKYDELTSLVKNHGDLLLVNSLKFKNTVHILLWSTFIDEYGYSQLGQFVEEHPNHWIGSDCWLEDYITAVSAKEKKALIQFLMKYPLSLIDPIVIRNLLNDDKDLGRLTKKEELFYENELEGVRLKEYLLTKDSIALADQGFYEKVYTYIKQTAPSRRAYNFTQSAIQGYLRTKNWERALSITKAAKPLFPDKSPSKCKSSFSFYSMKQNWFKTAMDILEGPLTNINLRPINELNTPDGEELSPVIMSNGQELYFASNNYEGALGANDIYLSTFNLDSNIWEPPTLLKGLSTEMDEAPLSITADGKMLLLFRSGKLFLSEIAIEGWNTPKPLSQINKEFPWIGRATLSPDGQVLIFAASRDVEEAFYSPRTDIFVSKKNEQGQFDAPFSIGRAINTYGGQERSPFLHTDGKTLYFSSDGHKGLGGTDVFMSTRLDSTWTNWSTPKNMGKEINTLEDDWGYNLSVDASAEVAYLSSDGFNWGYQSDLYATGIPKEVRATPQKIITAKINMVGKSLTTNPPKIIIKDAITGKIIDTVTPRPDGTLILPLAASLTSIEYEVQAEDALPTSGKINLDKVQKITIKEPIEYITKEDLTEGTAKINNIQFESGESKILPKSYKIITGIYELIRTDNSQLQIDGHTDNDGSAQLNQKLSSQRAESVKEYLVQLGIDPSRILTKGYGNSSPIADNQSNSGKALNRRVEIQIIEGK